MNNLEQIAEQMNAKVQLAISAVRGDSSIPTGSYAPMILTALRDAYAQGVMEARAVVLAEGFDTIADGDDGYDEDIGYNRAIWDAASAIDALMPLPAPPEEK